MKVFIVDIYNGYDYTDYEHEVVGVYKTFRGASEYLLGTGFSPYPDKLDDNPLSVIFEKYVNGQDKLIEAIILEFDLRE